MKINLSTFKSRLTYSDDFVRQTEKFIAEIERELGFTLNVTDLEDYECDLKLIFVQTGGSEGLFLKDFDKLQEPYYLLTSGSNNSLASSMEILTYLNKIGKIGEIIHGDVKYIAKRILELSTLERAKKQLSKSRLGVVGKPSDWLIASVPDYNKVKEKLGVTLVDIPIAEVEERVQNAVQTAETNYSGFAENELKTSAKILDALKEVVKDYRLDGLTIRCFDLLTSLKGTGCLALSQLNTDGIVGTCEGDVTAMLCMLIARITTCQSAFQANPSRIDAENNNILFAHCAVPFDMTKDYKFDTHFESGIGVAVKGEMKECRATIFRVSSDLRRYFVSNATIMENCRYDDLCRTQIVVKLDKPVAELLKNPCGNHHIIIYGEHADLLEKLFSNLLK